MRVIPNLIIVNTNNKSAPFDWPIIETTVIKMHTIDEPKTTLFFRPTFGWFINHKHTLYDKT